MNYIIPSLLYVISDPFFWPSMGMTVAIGIFIGSVIYDGVLSGVKKMFVSLACYALLIGTVNLTRVVPTLPHVDPTKGYQVFASIITVLIISLFYGLGSYLGVCLTKKAHKGVE